MGVPIPHEGRGFDTAFIKLLRPLVRLLSSSSMRHSVVVRTVWIADRVGVIHAESISTARCRVELMEHCYWVSLVTALAASYCCELANDVVGCFRGYISDSGRACLLPALRYVFFTCAHAVSRYCFWRRLCVCVCLHKISKTIAEKLMQLGLILVLTLTLTYTLTSWVGDELTATLLDGGLDPPHIRCGLRLIRLALATLVNAVVTASQANWQ